MYFFRLVIPSFYLLTTYAKPGLRSDSVGATGTRIASLLPYKRQRYSVDRFSSEEMQMFQPKGKNLFVISACLLFSTYLAASAHAGPMPPSPPSEIEGEYTTKTLGTPTRNIPIIFTLSGGKVDSPAFTGFSAPDVTIALDLTNGVTVTDDSTGQSDFNLSGGTAGYIHYNLNSPRIANSNDDIDALVRLAPTPPPNNTTGISLVFLNPALLTITFPVSSSIEPEVDPSVGAVAFFTITPIPEPATIVHLAWVGLLVIICYWRRNRRSVDVLAA
jgi:hypothetical protein